MQFIRTISVFVFCLGLATAGCAAQAAPPVEPSMSSQAAQPAPSEPPLPSFSTPVTPEEIRQAFYNYSVVSIVNALRLNHPDSANWNMILDKVDEGDREWIQTVLAYISPGTDASATTEVLVSLAYALPNNPQAVLSLAYFKGPPLYMICGLPFIEPEYSFVEDYGQRTLAALERVEEPYYLEPRYICASLLREALENCKKIYEEGRWEQ